MTATILIVDDEAAIRRLLTAILRSAGFEPTAAANAQEALDQLHHQRPDLILLDWMMPGMSGIDLTRRIRKQPELADLPIIMLTARGEEDSLITGLDGGCDDYIPKPFSNRELISRIKAVLRRQQPQALDKPLSYGRLLLNPASQRVMAGSDEISLKPIEYRLLKFLMSNPEKVYSRDQLLDRVWGGDVYIDDRTVDVHVLRLRKALKPHQCDQHIETVRGSGYRFASTL